MHLPSGISSLGDEDLIVPNILLDFILIEAKEISSHASKSHRTEHIILSQGKPQVTVLIESVMDVVLQSNCAEEQFHWLIAVINYFSGASWW